MEIVAFFLDGPKRGEVIETAGSSLVLYWRHPVLPDFLDAFGASDPPQEAMRAEIFTYHLHEYVIGGRTFRLWSTESTPHLIDEIKIIMALIDMDPSDVRECEVHERTELTAIVNRM